MTILSRRQPDDRASHLTQDEAMQLKHNAGKTEPSQDEDVAKVLDEMKPMASTTHRLGFMRGHGITRAADLKRGFADYINAIFTR